MPSFTSAQPLDDPPKGFSWFLAWNNPALTREPWALQGESGQRAFCGLAARGRAAPLGAAREAGAEGHTGWRLAAFSFPAAGISPGSGSFAPPADTVLRRMGRGTGEGTSGGKALGHNENGRIF